VRSLRRWFLPATPDVLGLLQEQTAITVAGIEALHRWASGTSGAARQVRESELRADERKRALRAALGEAFTTPLEPEDIFELSRGLDRVLDNAKNLVREAEVMGSSPDAAMAVMAAELAAGTRALAEAVGTLGRPDRRGATEAADKAVQSQRRLEESYRHAMSSLVLVTDLREIAAKRELYRRLARTSDDLREVAERIWYSVLKES